MTDLLTRLLKSPFRPPIYVMDEHVRNVHFTIDLFTKFLDLDFPLAGFAILLWKLTRSPQNEVSDRVIVVGNRLATKASRFKGDGTAAGERIEYSWRVPVVSDLYEVTGDPQNLFALWILRI